MKKNSFRILLTLSIASFLICIVVIYSLWSNLNELKTEIKILSDEKKVVSQENDALNKKLTQFNKDIEIISDTNFIRIDLNGSPDSPSSKAVVYWNPDSKKVYLKVESLPIPPSYKDYHLWAKDVKGHSVDAGILISDPADINLKQMKDIEIANSFLITLEDKKPRNYPDMLNLYASGKL